MAVIFPPVFSANISNHCIAFFVQFWGVVERKLVESTKRVKQWWFATENGKLAINLRYGARMLELAKGKFAIEVASEKELLPTLEALKTIAAAGELDLQIEAASIKLREGFGK